MYCRQTWDVTTTHASGIEHLLKQVSGRKMHLHGSLLSPSYQLIITERGFQVDENASPT